MAAVSAMQSRSPSAVVRLEVRVGSGRPTLFEVGDGGFLVGSVPGCDLRLPGTNLPPIICLISRHNNGASLRKLAPVQTVAVNGKPITATYLNDGDQIAIGSAEFLVAIDVPPQPPTLSPTLAAELTERARQIETRERQLTQAGQHLDSERAAYQRRRDELEAEALRQAQQTEQLTTQLRTQERDLTAARAELDRREQLFHDGNEVLGRREQEIEARLQSLELEEAEFAESRREFKRIRDELNDRLKEKRDQLAAQQEAVRKAARQVQVHKQQVDQELLRLETTKQEWSLKQAEIEARGEQVLRERDLVEEQHRLLSSRQQELQREQAKRLEELQAREIAVTDGRAALEKSQQQHQSDLVRLDRLQAGLDTRQRQLEQRAKEVDHNFEQLQRDTRDLEAQAAKLDQWNSQLTADNERITRVKAEQEAAIAEIEKRAASLEGQQTTLVNLRTRLERMKEDLRRQEQALSDQRIAHDAAEADIRSRREEAERLRDEAANDKKVFDEERRRFDERRAMLDQAVGQLRQAREALDGEQHEVRTRQRIVDEAASAQEQQASMLLTRSKQVEELQTRLQADRQVMREREVALSRAEQTLAALQEQVRKRSEELNERQRRLDESEQRVEGVRAEQQARMAQAEELQSQAAAELDMLRQELIAQAGELQMRSEEVAVLDQSAKAEKQAAEEERQSLAGQRQTLATERISWEIEKQANEEKQRQVREEFDKLRGEAQALVRQLPELEIRATSALERLGTAREQMREHLTELQDYARRSRDDLDLARRHLQGEIERVRKQEEQLATGRDEHHTAVAQFRQQLIDWQGKLAEMKQALREGSSRLELRQAVVEEQARQVADTQARVIAEAAAVEREKIQVAGKRTEMDRHLVDMRDWYRRKLRELAGVDLPPGEPGEGDIVPMPSAASLPGESRDPARAVLSLNDEVAPADRQMGELLASLGLVDTDTLQALWAEARRQRRSLRELLLNGEYLTLYQLALIEAGNLDALVLGPVRVIERLALTPREAVYRVFDPRRNGEAILRHLSEAEMLDAVRPDEFHQRFITASVVRHDNVAAVLEALTITERPAVLLEDVRGLPSGDWPGLVAAPGVWYRLVCQAAVALHAAHSENVCHGHIDSSSFVLKPNGTLKLVGLGEPAWLATGDCDESVGGDLFALGRVAAEWAALPPASKAKSKPLPDELRALLEHLVSENPDQRFPTALTLLEELERAGAKVRDSSTAWTRLLEKVREHEPKVRRSA